MRLTRKRLKSLLTYEPSTGIFRWSVTRNHLSIAGEIAGCRRKQGYVLIRIDGKLYRAHRLACFYMTGRWPRDKFDHADRDTYNNGWSNVRQATSGQNNANKVAQSNNSLGTKGVDLWTSSRGHSYYRMQIKCGDVRRTKYFKTKEEAAASYAEQAHDLFGEFARVA